jgi:tetratricopeptide (TPR) repeat protein
MAGVPVPVLNLRASLQTRSLRATGLALMMLALAACTPQAALLMSALPDGTLYTLLGNLQGMEDANRKRVAELEARKDWDGLVKLAEENLAKDRSNADWWTVAGYAHSQAGRHQRAIDCFREVVRLTPDEMLGWNLLAQSYRDAKQPARAVQALENALRVRTDSAETWYLLGETYSDVAREAQAATAYLEAVRVNNRFAQAWFGLGRSYARLGRPAEFEEVLKVLSELDAPLAKQLAALRPPAR